MLNTSSDHKTQKRFWSQRRRLLFPFRRLLGSSFEFASAKAQIKSIFCRLQDMIIKETIAVDIQFRVNDNFWRFSLLLKNQPDLAVVKPTNKESIQTQF